MNRKIRCSVRVDKCSQGMNWELNAACLGARVSSGLVLFGREKSNFMFYFFLSCCVSSSRIACPFPVLTVVILFLGFLSHRHFTKLPTRSAEKDLFLLIIIKGIRVCSTLSVWGLTAIMTISKNNMSVLEGFHYQQHKQNKKNIKSDRRLRGTVQRNLVINDRTPCWWKVGWSVVVHKTFPQLHSKNSVAAFS